jgi:hypothetical protein
MLQTLTLPAGHEASLSKFVLQPFHPKGQQAFKGAGFYGEIKGKETVDYRVSMRRIT